MKRNMDEVFGFPEIVRFSWSSCARILEESAVPVYWNDPVDEDSKPAYPGSKKRAVEQHPSPAPKKKTNNFFSIYQCDRLAIAEF